MRVTAYVLRLPYAAAIFADAAAAALLLFLLMPMRRDMRYKIAFERHAASSMLYADTIFASLI